MRTLSPEPMFWVETRPYSWRDVALFAALDGAWAPFERRVREGLACADHAQTVPEPDGIVEARATAFRYDEMLLSANELEGWLDARDVTLEEWMAWVRCDALREAWADELEGITARHTASPEIVEAAAAVALICSRGGRELAWRLADAAAAAAVEADGSAPQPPNPAGAATLPSLVTREAVRRAQELAAVADGERRFRNRQVSPDQIRRELDRGRLDWIRVEWDTLRLESEAAAREAALCSREDRLPLAELAREADTRVEARAAYLTDVDPALRSVLLGAAPGDTLGPLPGPGGHSVIVVREKLLPDEQDPVLWERARDRATARALAERSLHHVRWEDAGMARP